MRARGDGLIVNVTSDAGVQAYPTWGGYGASKAALEHLSRVLAAELEGSGVRVYVVDPGDMDTAMHRAAEPGVDLSHLPTPDRVAPAFVHLLDETAPSGRFEAQRLVAVPTIGEHTMLTLESNLLDFELPAASSKPTSRPRRAAWRATRSGCWSATSKTTASNTDASLTCRACCDRATWWSPTIRRRCQRR